MNKFVRKAGGKVIGAIGAAMLYVVYQRSVSLFMKASEKSTIQRGKDELWKRKNRVK